MSHTPGPAPDLSPLKQALVELRRLRARLAEVESHAQPAPIAVVGMGLRFPGGADTPQRFWDLLLAGAETATRVPADRWPHAGRSDGPDAFGAFLTDVDQFAPEFFGIAPREAELMDPQQRLLLEVAWEALEHAGQSPQRLFETQTGVFLGITNADYLRRLLDDHAPDDLDTYWTSGNAASVAAGRLSYVLGLRGPSIAIDTACSSSLVAVHQACHSLRSGETDLALAGGVNLILAPAIGVGFARAGMLAPDGHCKSFDARADGYVRGEGCGLIVLKRLADAQANGDRVLAVIRGSAVNQDGRSGGLTAPNGPSQEAVIRSALAQARVMPHDIGYLEAHGTGTPLGDPIELQALAAVLTSGRDPDRPLLLGTVKPNIGHLEAAAGIAGLIKTILILQHGQVPPHINVAQPSPHVDWHRLALELPRGVTTWDAPDGETRLAGVSSFGLSGTNAHVIVQAAPPPDERDSGSRLADAGEPPMHLLPVSARDPQELSSLVSSYVRLLADQPAVSAADVCFTAGVGRSHFEYRATALGRTSRELRAALEQVATADEAAAADRVPPAQPPETAFVFTGQGSLVPGTGQRLYATEAVFRAALDRCDALLAPTLGGSLVAALYAPGGAASSPMHDQQVYAQSALFAVQYALVELWAAWGIRPSMVLGHSLGEIAAACAAGVLPLESGLHLVAARGHLMQTLPRGGAMAAVQLDEDRARSLLAGAAGASSVSLAAINAPDSVVLTGDSRELQVVLDELTHQGVETRRLAIGLAAHSAAVDPILDAYQQAAARLPMCSPNVGMISGVTGQPIDADAATASYWVRNLRQPVRYADGVRSLWHAGCRTFVEIGPGATLLGMGRRCLPGADAEWLASLQRDRDDQDQMLDSLGALYRQGADVEWTALEAGREAHRVSLPTYPWQRQRYWALAPVDQASPPRAFDTAVRAASDQAQQAPIDLDLAAYPERWERLSALANAYIARCLAELDVFGHAGDTLDLTQVMRQGSIEPTYSRLIARWLGHLVDAGRLQRVGETTYRSPWPLRGDDVASAEQAAAQTLAEMPLLWAYVRRCGSALAGVVTGQQSALETLFPAGSSETAEYLYHAGPMARYANAIVRAATLALARGSRAAGQPLRIVEIGAGTGGTTRALLEPLADLVQAGARIEYVVTDVSDFFLARADAYRIGLPGLRTQVLDIELDPASQGFAPHRFDLVIAANVLHATVDLDRALRHTRSLLAPGGSLILYETTRHPSWLDVTTGLIAGWQRFADAWRSDHPLLDASEWQRALESVGFDGVLGLPDSGSAAAVLGQSVLLARTSVAAASVPTAILRAMPAPRAAQADTPRTTTAGSPAETALAPLIDRLAITLPDERDDLIVDFVRSEVAGVLRAGSGQKLGRDRRLMDLGLDSLMAIELRNRLEMALGTPLALPATLVFDHPSIGAIAAYLAGRLSTPEAASPGSPAPTGDGGRAQAVAEMSDAEVERLLLQRLDGL